MAEDDRETAGPKMVPESVRDLDPFAALRQATPARIGLGRTGDTMPLAPVLAFQQAHALARDAVHAALDTAIMAGALQPHETRLVRSAAPDRATFLKRPDLGRRLDPQSAADLECHDGDAADCVFIIADGLSALAVERHAIPVLTRCLPLLASLTIAPIVIATQARVALGDPIGSALRARLAVVMIGERPGLSVADSLGVYITFNPKVGRRDSERNCISNIHPAGLGYDEAATKIAWIVREALKRKLTGVALKDAERALPTS